MIERTRLLDNLLPKFRPGSLLLMTAGPGAGKTCLVHQLLTRSEGKTAFVNLKKISTDINAFVRCLEGVFKKLWPDPFSDLMPRHAAPVTDQASLQANFVFLLDELFLCGDTPAIIVLDGCEVFAARPLWAELISQLLQRIPPFISIVLLSTVPLKFSPFPRLRIQGQLLELTAEDIYFDHAETQQFLVQTVPGISDKYIRNIREKTGGWPAGLSLFCLEIQNRKKTNFLEEILPSTVKDYLTFEVLPGIVSDDLNILLKAALLQPCTYDDLEKISGISRDRLSEIFTTFSFMLDWGNKKTLIQFSNIFSHFFIEHASTMLAKNEIRNLHKKAAKYFKKQRNVDRVLVHLVALSAWSPVVKLLLSGNSKWSKIEDYERLLFWIDQLPEAVITKHPVLSILLGKAYLYLGRLDIAWKNLKRAQDYTRVGSKNWLESGCRLCEILLLKGYLEEGTELAEQVVDRAGFVSRHKAEGLMFQAIGLHLLCRFDECERLWRHISTLASSRFLPLDQAARCYLMAPKAVFYNLERGEFKESERILDLAITVFRSKDPRKRLGWVLLFKGVVKLELQQKKEAVMWFREAVEVSGKTNRSVHAGCTAFLSYVLADLGETDEAKEWLDRAAPIVSNDLTLWAPVLCALARTMMAGDPNTALNELHLAWNLAKQRKMLLPISFIAYTAFLVRNQIGRLEAERFCRKAAGISEQNRVQHREAQHLLNLHQMDREQGGALDSPELSKAMTIISQKRLGFVLVNTRQADCLELVIQAVQEDIDTDYFLSLCKHWGKRACAALISIFDCASPVVKEKIATVWTENGYRPALPHIQHILKVSRHKKTKTVFKAMLCKLERSPLEPLHIALLGSFNLIKGETHLLEGSWKRKKSKELFKLLCLNPSTTFTQDYLMELFWPESSPDKAKANLWSVVSSLKLTLEPELSSRAKSNYLLYNGYSYQLRLPVGSTVDALLFEENARQGIHYRKTGDNARALICLAMADELYKGELLPDNLYEVWSEEAREHLKSMFTRVLRVMAEIYFEQREFGKCIELYQRIIKIDLWDEKSYLALMQCYVLQGNDLMAIRIFKNCEKVLGKELNVTPNEHLQAMLQRILRRRLVSCQPSNVG